MVNQRDVAKLAGVSSATVSRYINSVGFISEDIKKRIAIVIDELNYQPNLIARSLKMRNSNTIGFIFPDIENTFFISLIKKAEEVAFESGYTVILCNTQNNPEKEKLYIRALKGKMVDGFIIITSFKSKEYLEKALKGEKVVFLDRDVGMNETVVKLDNARGIEMAVDYLTGLGHRKIGYINVKPDITIGIERLEGYNTGLKKAGIPYDQNLVKFSGFSIESSYEKTKELFSQKTQPTALIPISNRVTIGALRALKDLKIKIPDDVSVVGFDDITTADLLTPPLTVIEQPAYDFGEEGIKILIEKINGTDNGIRIINLEPEIVIRESCKKFVG